MFLSAGKSAEVVYYLIVRCDWRVSGIQASSCCKEHCVRVLEYSVECFLVLVASQVLKHLLLSNNDSIQSWLLHSVRVASLSGETSAEDN